MPIPLLDPQKYGEGISKSKERPSDPEIKKLSIQQRVIRSWESGNADQRFWSEQVVD